MTEHSPTSEVTTLLRDWRLGDPTALDRLIPLVYDELRRVARAHRRSEREDHSLQTTALVHEVYLKLVGLDRMTLRDRAHFLALAGRLMRQILVDDARNKRAAKRGGGATMVDLADVSPAVAPPVVDILALDEALDELTRHDPRLCRVVELKFFAGLSIDETAEALDVSTATVERDWALAKAWLYQWLSAPAAGSKPRL
jgi:RNA polymerase sigma factor (TIGR02999 family)